MVFLIYLSATQGGSDNETCLHMACRIDASKGEKCLIMLLKSGADPNMTMADGRTPLHIAAGDDGYVSVVQGPLKSVCVDVIEFKEQIIG